MVLAAGLRLDFRQTQSLVLTPQLQQAIRLLQMSNVELSAAVDREVADNPFLDRADRSAASPPDIATTAGPQDLLRPRTAERDEGWQQPAAGAAADATLRIRRSAQGPSEAFSSIEGRLANPRGLREHLREQLVASTRSLLTRELALTLVDWLDEDGYLREPDEELGERLGVPPERIAEARQALQTCDPTGIGAQDLARCLALQLAEHNRLDPAMQRLLDSLNLLARADFAELMRRCEVDVEDLQDMIVELKRLDPRPGRSFAPTEPVGVVPDVLVYRTQAGTWRAELNGGTLPRVLVDRGYHAEIAGQQLDRGAKDYLSDRIQAANWLVKALDQRARTMLKVAKAIFGRQRGFLDQGVAALRPLVLRDIAEITGLHESTVSRATAEKFVATPHGTFPLKFFFTTAIPAAAGEEAHSAEAIRQQIRRLIDREDPKQVLSDDQIVIELRGQGVIIARRTVAKYRESLGIASSIERRRAKALGR